MPPSWYVICPPSAVRTLQHLLVFLLVTGSMATAWGQETPAPNDRNKNTDPNRELLPERSMPDVPGRSPEESAGNPEGTQNPGNTQFADTAFSSLVLDPGQLERIHAMDARYAEEFISLGSVTADDPRYIDIWNRRRKEIATILTPIQFERWQELNGEREVKEMPPADMQPQQP